VRRVKPIPGNLPLFAPESEWKAPNLSDLPDWSRAKIVSLDTEFVDKTLRELGIGSRRGAYIAGYSFMLDGGRPYYIPLRHPGGGNVDLAQGLRYLKEMLWKFAGILVMVNGAGDLDLLETTEGIKPNYDQCEVQDICIRGPLINELHHKYGLEAEAARWGVPSKDKTKLKEAAQSYGYDVDRAGWEACIGLLPAKYVGVYGEADVVSALAVYHAQQKVIEEQGLQEVVLLESQLLPILNAMRMRGIKIDFDHLARVEQFAIDEERKAVAEIKNLSGYDIGFDNCMAASAVAPALIAVGHTPPLTDDHKKIQYSVTGEFLESIDHPVGKLIRHCRKVNKLRTTFCASIHRYQTHGRIHTTFRQIVGSSEKNEKSGAAFGRLSSAHLNIQQQPSRDKFASFWRQIYLPEDDSLLLSADFSSQEPRWTVHFADLLKLTGAHILAELYRTDPRVDPHQAMADITGLPRKDAKQVFLGLSYNMGGVKLCVQSLGLPTRWVVETEGYNKHYFATREDALRFRKNYDGRCRLREVAGEEGQLVIDKFHNGAPFLKELIKRVSDKIESTGVLKILGGRHLHFPQKEDGNYDWSFKGLNRLVQGTSGYHLKKAIIALWKECPEFFMQITVHDELLGSITNMQTAKRVQEVMVNAVKARVPFRVDLECGPSWGAQRLICMENHCTEFVNPDIDKMDCPEHALKKVA
jgi:DNA polymerase I-like protein with 3'-5' exonuclease and polymerase domains